MTTTLIEEQPTRINPWLSIWFKPRATFQHLTDMGSEKVTIVLAVLFGILHNTDRAFDGAFDRYGSPLMLIPIILLGGGLGGYVLFRIGSRVLRLASKLFGGDPDVKDLRTVLAWCNLPYIIGILVFLPFNLMFFLDLFNTDSVVFSVIGLLVLGLILVVGIIIQIWRLIFLVVGISEVNQFSIWRSVGTAVVAALLIGVPIAILAGLIVFSGAV